MNRICQYEEKRKDEPRPVGEVLEELLAQYEARFPGLHTTVVETAVAA
jgi:hypothetical protein